MNDFIIFYNIISYCLFRQQIEERHFKKNVPTEPDDIYDTIYIYIFFCLKENVSVYY